jgi:hypothetical protein
MTNAGFVELEQHPIKQTAGGPVNTGTDVTAANVDKVADVTVVELTDDKGRTTLPPSSPPPTTTRALAPATLQKTLDPSGLLGSSIDYTSWQGAPSATACGHPLDSDGMYTLPTGHFGSGLGGPSTPISNFFPGQPKDQDDANALHNARAAHEAGRQHCLAMGSPSNPYPTPSQPPRLDAGQDDAARGPCPSLPCLGSLILLPRAHHDCTKGVNIWQTRTTMERRTVWPASPPASSRTVATICCPWMMLSAA